MQSEVLCYGRLSSLTQRPGEEEGGGSLAWQWSGPSHPGQTVDTVWLVERQHEFTERFSAYQPPATEQTGWMGKVKGTRLRKGSCAEGLVIRHCCFCV